MNIGLETLVKLREAVAQTGDGVDALREAGYAGGNSLFDSFANWARDKDGMDVTQLPLPEFSERCAEFFRTAEWGQLTVKDGDNGVAIAEVENCWESAASQHTDGHSGCHITTGLLSAFFGKMADYPMAV